MHNGFVNISGEKMSKSLNNFTTIRAFLDNGVDPMVLRLFVLQAHYRKPIDFTDEAIASAQNAWTTLKEGLLFGYQFGEKLGFSLSESQFVTPELAEKFQSAMDDDLNTSGGIAVLFELAKDLRKESNILTHQGTTETDAKVLEQQWRSLVNLAQVIGLEVQPETEVKAATTGINEAEIEDLIQQRKDARKAKNFKESDRIRDELKSQGIELVDLPGGETRWHRS
jgi:cysteinyl-tRNA synthetase